MGRALRSPSCSFIQSVCRSVCLLVVRWITRSLSPTPLLGEKRQSTQYKSTVRGNLSSLSKKSFSVCGWHLTNPFFLSSCLSTSCSHTRSPEVKTVQQVCVFMYCTVLDGWDPQKYSISEQLQVYTHTHTHTHAHTHIHTQVFSKESVGLRVAFNVAVTGWLMRLDKTVLFH